MTTHEIIYWLELEDNPDIKQFSASLLEYDNDANAAMLASKMLMHFVLQTQIKSMTLQDTHKHMMTIANEFRQIADMPDVGLSKLMLAFFEYITKNEAFQIPTEGVE